MKSSPTEQSQLFKPAEVLRRKLGEFWYQSRDADEVARALFHRHYSRYEYKDGRQPKKFVGPGEHMVLLTGDARALFVWRKFISDDGQQGINCAIFRNESAIRSSDLILEAEFICQQRWTGERMYTYVNPRKVKSANPGYCFKMAGWKQCGITKSRKMVILEKLPA